MFQKKTFLKKKKTIFSLLSKTCGIKITYYLFFFKINISCRFSHFFSIFVFLLLLSSNISQIRFYVCTYITGLFFPVFPLFNFEIILLNVIRLKMSNIFFLLIFLKSNNKISISFYYFIQILYLFLLY